MAPERRRRKAGSLFVYALATISRMKRPHPPVGIAAIIALRVLSIMSTPTPLHPLLPGRRVSVVIPTWRRSDLLRNCLESLRQQTRANFEIILVSNGAGNWADRLAEEFGCALVKFPENRGFAAAVNAGIARSHAPYVAVLNDDVQLSPQWLEQTTAFLDSHPEASFCCGKIFQADGILLDNAGDALSLAGSAWRLGFGRKDSPDYDVPRPIFLVSATASLFRRGVFELVGMLDETFFSYLEDIDFSVRAARSGFRGCYLPQAVSRHWGSATLGGPDSAAVFRWLTQNQLLLLAKHYPWPLLARCAPRILWAQLLWAAMALRKRRFRAYGAGILGFLRLLPGTLRRRARWRRGQWRTFRNMLRESERALYRDVTAPDRACHDTFWRLYFRLFPVRGRPEAAPQADLKGLAAR